MEDITYDLVSGGVLDLAELYAADCLGSQAEQAVEDFLRTGPEPVRHQFFLGVEQTREALLLTSGSLHAEPTADLLPRILAQLPVPPPTTKRNLSAAPALLTLPNKPKTGTRPMTRKTSTRTMRDLPARCGDARVHENSLALTHPRPDSGRIATETPAKGSCR